jgi:hypothetical protein
MKTYKVREGQDIFTVVETLYGTQDYLFKFIQDNNLSVVDDLVANQEVVYDETISNNIIDYYKLNGIIANNSDWITGLEPLQIILYKLIPQTDDNLGSIYINMTGGRGEITNVWSNGETNTNMITNLTEGYYTVTATDETGYEISQTYYVPLDLSGQYLSTENDEHISTEDDDNIIT